MLRMIGFRIFLFAVAAISGPAFAADLVVYDDASENGFNQNCSFGAAPNFAETTFVHTGIHGISFSAPNFAAVSWCTPGNLSTTNYNGITFWVNGGVSGGQDLHLVIGLLGTPVVDVPLVALLGHPIAVNTWAQVTASFDNAPTQFNGAFDQISLQSNNMSAQPTVYFDDVSLIGRASGADWIFKSGFEGSVLPPPACGMTQEHDVTVGSMVSDRFTWCDSANSPRVSVLAHNDGQVGPTAGVYANRGGALREFRYQMPNATTRTASVTTYGNGGYGGFGYVVSHTLNQFCNGDDSPLGYSFSGGFQRVFEGRHHAIFRFTQNYQRHCGPNAPATTLVPVTIDWMMATGHDNPLWAITYDLSAISADYLYDDSRAPYGELNIDGDGFSHNIDGVAWGDKYKFTSTTAPLTLSSSWTWNVANTIPYVKEWIVASDATMGLVQTQTIDEQDAGAARDPNGYDVSGFWNKTSANGAACAASGYAMPCQDNWPYQADNDSINASTPNNNARLTWGTQYGFLGQSSYAANTNTAAGNNGPFLPGYPKKSYSVHVVLGPHSTSPVEAQVTQAEVAQTLTMSTTVGSVITSGPAGINRADTINYAPGGYNHVYGALALAANAANQLDANVAVGSGTLKKPLLILSNYAGAYPSSVKLNGTSLTVDVDYFPSMRAGSDELWITFNQNFSGATNHIQITP